MVLMGFRVIHVEGNRYKYAFDGLQAPDEVWWSALDWCVEEFGRQVGADARRWTAGHARIYFQSVEDATHFRLRWC
jgi:hypothetical protein